MKDEVAGAVLLTTQVIRLTSAQDCVRERGTACNDALVIFFPRSRWDGNMELYAWMYMDAATSDAWRDWSMRSLQWPVFAKSAPYVSCHAYPAPPQPRCPTTERSPEQNYKKASWTISSLYPNAPQTDRPTSLHPPLHNPFKLKSQQPYTPQTASAQTSSFPQKSSSPPPPSHTPSSPPRTSPPPPYSPPPSQ